jgi:ABC-2 type transport system permease protein
MTDSTLPTPDSAPRPRNRGGGLLFGNPIVLKELRGRMRGSRAFVVLTVYLVLMSGFATLSYLIASSRQDTFGFTASGEIGRELFRSIVGIELFLVAFIAPAFTAGAISGERERQTYDLLKTTLLPAGKLVVGKLVSALSYVFLLLFAAIPLQSIAFLFGGVTEAEVILSFIILIVMATTLAAAGLYFSTRTERTLSANVMTYAFTMFLTVGSAVIVLLIRELLRPLIGYVYEPTGISSGLSIPAFTVLSYVGMLLMALSPLTTAVSTQSLLVNQLQAGVFTQTFNTTTGAVNLLIISPWILFTIVYLLIAVVLMLMAVRRIQKIEL